MKSSTCAHEACECRVDTKAGFCSASCESAAALGDGDCACGHDACLAAGRAREHSIDGNQGEGNREAYRRYREAASDFAARREGRSRR